MLGDKYQVARSSVITVGLTDTTALGGRSYRQSALLVNDSDTVIYLKLGDAAVVNQGIRLNSNGGSYEINAANLWVGSVHAISGAAAKTLLVTEVYLSDVAP